MYLLGLLIQLIEPCFFVLLYLSFFFLFFSSVQELRPLIRSYYTNSFIGDLVSGKRQITPTVVSSNPGILRFQHLFLAFQAWIHASNLGKKGSISPVPFLWRFFSPYPSSGWYWKISLLGKIQNLQSSIWLLNWAKLCQYTWSRMQHCTGRDNYQLIIFGNEINIKSQNSTVLNCIALY